VIVVVLRIEEGEQLAGLGEALFLIARTTDSLKVVISGGFIFGFEVLFMRGRGV
jgi:hypothetical protein